MNPWEFSGRAGGGLVLATTYAFDPVFFERVALRQLRKGYSLPLVVADRNEVDSAIARLRAPLFHLGRSYLLSSPGTASTFHPKVTLRLQDDGGEVHLSSGNLTRGGWGGNGELASAWRLGPGGDDLGLWLVPLLGFLGAELDDDLVAPFIDAATRIRWIDDLIADSNRGMSWTDPASKTEVESPVLLSLSESLTSQLARRWSGRRFERLRLMTGSTDVAGWFLEWVVRQFGVTRIDIAVDLTRAAFDGEMLEQIDAEILVHPHLGPKPLHAKCYLLDGPEGAALIHGSANCSRAAWGSAVHAGGNAEAIRVEDDVATPTDHLENLFEGPGGAPSRVLTGLASTPPGSGRDESGGSITELVLDGVEDVFRVTLTPPVADSEAVTLVVGGRRVPLAPDGQGGWCGGVPSDLSRTATLVAAVQVGDPVTRVTRRRWVDDSTALESHRSRMWRRRISLQSAPRSRREENEILRELGQFASELFADEGRALPVLAVPRPERSRQSSLDGRVDPALLVRSLGRKEGGGDLLTLAGGQRRTLGVRGLFSALFRGLEPEEAETDNDSEVDDAEAISRGADPEAIVTKEPVVEAPPREPANGVSDRAKASVRAEMGRLFDKLAEPDLPDRIDGDQLANAIAFALNVSVIGCESGWVEDRDRSDWVSRLASVLLLGSEASNCAWNQGLFWSCGDWAFDKGEEDRWLDAVGDGTIWVSLLGALAQPDPNLDDDRALTRATVLYELSTASDMLIRSSEARVRSLARRFHFADALAFLDGVALPLVEAMSSVRVVLDGGFQQLTDAEVEEQPSHSVGDLLWSPRAGWARAIQPAKSHRQEIYLARRGRLATVPAHGTYVNVDWAATRDDALALQVGTFRRCLSRLAGAHDGTNA